MAPQTAVLYTSTSLHPATKATTRRHDIRIYREQLVGSGQAASLVQARPNQELSDDLMKKMRIYRERNQAVRFAIRKLAEQYV